MSKWRPCKTECIYVIPDIHGNLNLTKKICDRILPLRRSDGIKDQLILLGDYIDRHVDSHLLIDYCIELQKKYPTQATFLMGNHELMLLESLNIRPNKNCSLQDMASTYKMWMSNGGLETIYGYRQRNNLPTDWDHSRSKVLELFPKEHIEFFRNLKKYYEYKNWIFVHGGVNPLEDPKNQDLEVLVWDRSLKKFVENALINKVVLPWEKTVVCGHSVNENLKPIIADNYLMLDCGSPRQLLAMELNTREMMLARPRKNRLVKK